MVSDAESHAEEDRQAREAADTRNRADQMVYQVEKTLRDTGGKVPEGERQETETAVAEVKRALERGDTGEIKAATERLEKASHRLAETIYREQAGQQSAGGAASAGGDGRPGNDDVIDAEVVDERKN
jgi:molecular chaperone DnaK